MLKDPFYFLDQTIQNTSISLPAQRSQNETKPFSLSIQCPRNLFTSSRDHGSSCVLFFSKFPAVWTILIELKLWVGDHRGLHMKSAVAKEDHYISSLWVGLKSWGGASQDLSCGSWLFLWDDNGSKLSVGQCLFCQKERVVELDRAKDIDGLMLELREVEDHSFHEVLNIYLNLHEHIQHFSKCISDGNEARMSIVNQQITVHLVTCEVINTTGSVCHITHNHDFNRNYSKFAKNVVDNACEEHQSFRKLKRDLKRRFVEFFGQGFDAIESFVDFEIIVRRKDLNGIVEGRIACYVFGNARNQCLLFVVSRNLLSDSDGFFFWCGLSSNIDCWCLVHCNYKNDRLRSCQIVYELRELFFERKMLLRLELAEGRFDVFAQLSSGESNVLLFYLLLDELSSELTDLVVLSLDGLIASFQLFLDSYCLPLCVLQHLLQVLHPLVHLAHILAFVLKSADFLRVAVPFLHFCQELIDLTLKSRFIFTLFLHQNYKLSFFRMEPSLQLVYFFFHGDLGAIGFAQFILLVKAIIAARLLSGLRRLEL